MSFFSNFDPNAGLAGLKADKHFDIRTNQEVEEYYGLTPIAIKKMVEATRSAEEKTNLLADNKLKKESTLEGFKELEVSLTDTDSLRIHNADGTFFETRVKDFSPFDAIDTYLDKKSAYSIKKQNDLLSEMYSKPVSELNDTDRLNFKNYQSQDSIRRYTDPNYKFETFDKSKAYASVDPNFKFKVLVKQVGTDNYSEDIKRPLIETRSLANGANVSYDLSTDPYMNAQFSLYKSIDNSPNRRLMQNYLNSTDPYYKRIFEEIGDDDNRVAETLDMAQAEGYKSWMRFLNFIDVDFLDNPISKLLGEDLSEIMKDLDDHGNRWAGVKQSTLENFYSEMNKGSKLLDEGQYIRGAWTWLKQLDRVYANSAVDMALLMASYAPLGTAFKAIPIIKALAATGRTGEIAARIGGRYFGSSLASLNIVTRIDDNYFQNNGEHMSPARFLLNFAISNAALIPDQLIGASFIPFRKAMVLAATKQLLTTKGVFTPFVVRTLLKGFGEGTQETVQSAQEDWASQKQDTNLKSFFEVLRSTARDSFVIGFLMAAAPSVALDTVALPKNILKQRSENKNQVKQDAKDILVTRTGTKLTEEQIAEQETIIKDIRKSNNLTFLTKIIEADDISIKTEKVAREQRKQVLIDIIKDKSLSNDEVKAKVLDITNKADTTVDEIFEQVVYGTGFFNKNLSPAQKDLLEHDLTQFGKKLAIHEDTIKKTLKTVEEVKEDVKYSPASGYTSFNKMYNEAAKELEILNKDPEKNKVKIDKLEKKKAYAANRINVIKKNQITKLRGFLSALESLLKGNATMETAYWQTVDGAIANFEINRKNVVNDSIGSGKSVFNVVDSIFKNLNDLNKITDNISELNGTNNSAVIAKLQQQYEALVTGIKEKAKSDPKVVKTAAKLNTKLKATDGKLDYGKTLRTIYNAFTSKDDNKLVALKSEFSIKELKELKEHLTKTTKNPNSKFYKETIKALDSLITQESEVTTSKAKILANTKQTIESANRFKNKVTPEFLNNLEDIEVFAKLRNAYFLIKQSLTTASALKENESNKELQELLKYFDSLKKSILTSDVTTFTNKLEAKKKAEKAKTDREKEYEQSLNQLEEPSDTTTVSTLENELIKLGFKQKTKTINNNKITYWEVTKKYLNDKYKDGRLATTTLDGIILIAKDVSKQDILEHHKTGLKKNIIELFNTKHNTDLLQLLETIPDDKAFDFILLHEARHVLQATKKREGKSFKELLKENKNNYKLQIEVDAHTYAFTELGINVKNFKFEDTLKKQSSNTESTEQPNTESNTNTVNVWYGSNENAELSNLAYRPFVYKNREYHSVEHAYQTNKSGKFDKKTYEAYTLDTTTKIQGKLKAKTENNWNVQLMETLIELSFTQNLHALQTLLATGNAVITHTQDKGIWNKEFPRILMKVRTKLSPNTDTKQQIDVKNDAEQHGYNKHTGWKFHLSVSKKNRAKVNKYLTDNGFDFKEGNNGGQTGKDFTIYIGSYLLASKLAKQIETDIGKLLKINKKTDASKDDTSFSTSNKILARFDTYNNKKYHQYGKNGIPVLNKDASLFFGLFQNQTTQEEKNKLLQKARIALQKEYKAFFDGRGKIEEKNEDQFYEDQITVYHGSAFEIDKLSTHYIGVGQGQQTRGWGLYFSRAKKVAKEYQRIYANRRSYLVNNKPVTSEALKPYFNEEEAIKLAHLLATTADKHIEEAIRNVNAIEKGKSNGRKYNDLQEEIYKRNKFLLDSIQKLTNLKVLSRSNSKGTTLEVKIPNSKFFLSMSGLIAYQNDYIKNVVQDILNSYPELRKDIDGKGLEISPSEFYNALVKKFGSPKEVSLFLDKKGIKGIFIVEDFQTENFSTMSNDFILFNDKYISYDVKSQSTDSTDINKDLKKSNKQLEEKKEINNSSSTDNDPTNFNTTEESIEILEDTNGILTEDEVKIFDVVKPKIAVASEHTDPVFFAKKILKALETGLYNGLYIITKHDGLPIESLIKYKIPKIIHFSITGLGGTKYEAGVMKPDDLLDRIAEFIKLGLDPNAITIRIDPIVPGVTTTEMLENIIKRGSELGIKNFRFSIMDQYSTTRKFMKELGYDHSKYYDNALTTHAKKSVLDYYTEELIKLADKYDIKLATCAEPITNPKVSKEACLSVNAVNNLLGTNLDPEAEKGKQRKECSCYGGKSDLLAYNDKCHSSCAYCYAHHNSNTAMQLYNEDGTLKDNAYTKTSITNSVENDSKTNDLNQTDTNIPVEENNALEEEKIYSTTEADAKAELDAIYRFALEEVIELNLTDEEIEKLNEEDKIKYKQSLINKSYLDNVNKTKQKDYLVQKELKEQTEKAINLIKQQGLESSVPILQNNIEFTKPKCAFAVLENTDKAIQRYYNSVIKVFNLIVPIIRNFEYWFKKHPNNDFIAAEANVESQLLWFFNTIETEQGIDLKNKNLFVQNKNVAVTIDFSIREFFSDMNLTSTFLIANDRHLASVYGLNEENMSKRSKVQARELLKTHGIPRAILASRLGLLILENLGIKKKSNGIYGYYEKLAAGIGTHALIYATERGWLEATEFDVNKWSKNQLALDKNPYHFLQGSERTSKYRTQKGSTEYVQEDLFNDTDNNEEDFTQITDQDIDDSSSNKSTIQFIKIKGDTTDLQTTQLAKAIEYYNNYLSDFKLDDKNTNDFPSTESLKVEENNTFVRNTKKLMKISHVVKKAFDKLFSSPFVIQLDLINSMFTLNKQGEVTDIQEINNLKERLGYVTKDKLERLQKDQKESAIAANDHIDQDVANFLRLVKAQWQWSTEKKNVKWFYKWYCSRSGRIYLDSLTTNPQTSKQLHRFLITPKNMQEKFEIGNAEHEAAMYYAIDQAFGMVKTKNNIKAPIRSTFLTKIAEVEKEKEGSLLKDVINLNKEQFKNKYGLEIDNVGHAINVAYHLQQYNKVKALGNKSFKTFLAVENDSTTSGFFLKTLLFPNFHKLFKNTKNKKDSSIAAKVGIFDVTNGINTYTMHELKQKDDFYDIYETVAEQMSIPTLPPPSFKREVYNPLYEDNETIVPVADIETLQETYKLLVKVLPQSKVGLIDKALRTLLKVPTMVTGYSAGFESMVKELSNEMYTTLIKDWFIGQYKIQDGLTDTLTEREKDLNTLFDFIGKHYKTKDNISLFEALKETSTVDLDLTFTETFKTGKTFTKKVSLDTFFTDVLAPTYGKAVFDAVEAKLGYFNDFSKAMNKSFQLMFQVFEYNYNEGMSILRDNNLRDNNTENITDEQEKELVESLFKVMPIIKTAYSYVSSLEGFDTGLNIIKTAKDLDPAYKGIDHFYKQTIANTKAEQGRSTKVTSYHANVQKFIQSAKAGSVSPIHFIDSMIMTLVANKYGDQMIPVHDAIVMNALTANEKTHFYNRIAYCLGKDYDLLQIISDRLDEVIKNSNFEMNTEFYEEVEKLKIGNKNFKGLRRLLLENKKNRELFYKNTNNKYAIGNMDGENSSSVYVVDKEDSIANIMFELGILENKEKIENMGLNPNGYTSNVKIASYQNNIDSTQTSLDILEDLNKMDRNPISKDFHEHLKSLISKIDIKHLKDTIVKVFEDKITEGNFEFTRSAKEIKDKVIKIVIDNNIVSDAAYDAVRELNLQSYDSSTAAYAHEILHAAFRYAFDNHKELGLSKHIEKLLELQRQAKIATDYTVFMPDNYDPKLKSEYEYKAKQMYDYIFNYKDVYTQNPANNLTAQENIEQLRSLAEFTAYAMTHEKFMDKLKNTFVTRDKVQKKTMKGEFIEKVKLLDRIIALAGSILDLFSRTGSFKEVVDASIQLVKGRVDLRKNKSIFESLETLNDRLINTKLNAIDLLSKHPLRAVETMFEFMHELIGKGENYITPKLKYLANIGDKRNWIGNINLPNFPSLFDKTAFTLKIIGFIFVSDTARKHLGTFLKDVMGLSQQGVIQTVLREITEPDLATSELHVISNLTRIAEKASKELEYTVYRDLCSALDKEPTEEESIAMTKAVLFTDLSVLLDTTSVSNIIEYLKDNSKTKARIDTLTQKLRSITKSDEQFNFYSYQIESLAERLITGNPDVVGLMNAYNISKGFGLGNQFTDIGLNTEQIIDEIITLKALLQADSNSVKIVSNMKEKALEKFLQVHRTFVKESVTDPKNKKTTGVPKAHMIKGYTKFIADSSSNIVIDHASQQQYYEDLGYKILKVLPDNPITGQKGLMIYSRAWSVTEHREGAAFLLRGTHSMGTTLLDSAHDMFTNAALSLPTNSNAMTPYDLYKEMRNKVFNLTKQLNRKILNGTLTLEQSRKVSKGYTPVVDTRGKVNDFRIIMSNENKEKLLKANLSAYNLLPKMYASNELANEAPIRNNAIIDFLKENMKNMDVLTNLDQNGKRYIEFTENSSVKFLRDSWQAVPKELKDEVKRMEENKEILWVREDWLGDLLGVPSTSLVENETIRKYTNASLKYAILLGEHIMKHIAYLAKQNTVIRLPVVVLGNIMSNFNYSVASGNSPLKVLKKTIDNSRNIHFYVETKNQLNSIKFRKRLGTATKAESDSEQILQVKLQHNPVHELMEKGMYSAIIEDLTPNDLEAVGKINKFISLKLKHVPSPLKWMFKQLYMMEGTSYFDMMFKATQYSDFVARATQYQLTMEKFDKKQLKLGNKNYKKVGHKGYDEYVDFEKQLTFDIWNAFVNYDKPQSSKEQYLNDMGLLMFTKYGKRIQHMVTKGFIEHPITSLLFLISNSVMTDAIMPDIMSETIFDQFVLTKHWTSLAHNPFDNFLSALIPVPLHHMLGISRRSWYAV